MVDVRLIAILRGETHGGGLFSTREFHYVYIKNGLTMPHPPTPGMSIRLYQPSAGEFPRMMYRAETVIYDIETGRYDCIDNLPAGQDENQLRRYEEFGFVRNTDENRT